MSGPPEERTRGAEDPLLGGGKRSGMETTMVKRVLERRASQRAATDEGTTATMAVMVRVVPTPHAWLAFDAPGRAAELARHVMPGVLECEVLSTEEARRRCAEESKAVIFTDNLELIRQVRARVQPRSPFIVYLAELDNTEERTLGLNAGADECIGRRASEREFQARIASARRVAELEAVLRITLEENRKLSSTDDLTRVASRRFFGKHFPREVHRAARYGRALSLILCDIDNFKQINDSRGHAAGDDILRQFGPRLQRLLRANVDWVARIGGEEFAIVLPELAFPAALEVARKLRALIAHTVFKAQGKPYKLTASFGLCGLDHLPADGPMLAERMLRAADAALYRSKNTGRDRVTAAQSLGPTPRHGSSGRPQNRT
jgi:two-component system, cell cycle response regulator